MPPVELSASTSKFEEFLREKYYPELLKAVKDEKAIVVDFDIFDRYDPITADMLLEDPAMMIKSFDEAVQNIVEEPVRVRFRNLPESRQIRIRSLRAKHLGKFMQIDATIKSATEVRPQIHSATFECPDCSAKINVVQDGNLMIKPIMCECGRRGDFPLLSKNLIDTRWMTGIEPFEITTGEQPGELPIFLKEDLTTPKMQKKTDPGSSLRITGVLKELPRRIKGKQTTKMDIYLEANHVETREIEYEDLEITPEDEMQIKNLANDPEIYEKLKMSIAPGIYGFEEIKEAVALQLFGGVAHHMPDGSRIRGNLHILLCGDPGCLIGDERIVLGNGAIVKMQDFGKEHLQSINMQILTGEGGAKRDRAKVFHIYRKQPIIEIVTETGKSIKGTYNHPLLCIRGENGVPIREWKRLDEMKIGDKLSVVTGIPCTITAPIETNFKPVQRKYGHKFKGKLPKYVTEELAAFMGYVLGDGWVRERKTEIGFIVAEPEMDILDKLADMSKSLFSISPALKKYLPKSGYIGERLVKRKMPLTYGYLYSQDIASNFDFVKAKRVPDLILRSSNKVVASFLRWLYEADGSVFDKGRGNRSINLKSKNIEFLRDVQILLLRFSIHSRILGDNNLMIRRGESILKFAKHIGFASEKKKTKLAQLAKSAEGFKHFKPQRTERIVKIVRHEPEDVYDIEVSKSHRFIANGIISHNTGKTQMLKLVSTVVPRGKYVSGSGVTGAGMTASVRKDEIIGTWVLEAGALILANKSVIGIDEFDKINRDDQVALHEAMSVETISIAKASIVATLPAQTAVLAGANPQYGRFDTYKTIIEQIQIPETLLSVASHEPTIFRENGRIKVEPISALVDKYSNGQDSVPVEVSGVEVPAMNHNFKIKWWPVKYVFRHKASLPIYKFKLDTGRNISVTKGHSLFVFSDAEIKTIPSDKIQKGDWIVIPKKLPGNSEYPREINLAEELNKLPRSITEGIFIHRIPREFLQKLGIKNNNWLQGGKLPLSYYDKIPKRVLNNCVLKYKGGVKSGVPVTIHIGKELMRLLGYYIAEGCILKTTSSEHLISLCFGNKDDKLIRDAIKISEEMFGHEARTIKNHNSIKVNIANKVIWLFFEEILKISKLAGNKRVPEIVWNVNPELQKEFLRAYHAGDYCVTVSESLMSDVLYLMLINNVIASAHRTESKTVKFPDGHVAVSKPSWSLVDSADKISRFKSTKWYAWVPLEPVKEAIALFSSSKYKGHYYGDKKRAQFITPKIWDTVFKPRFLKRLKLLEHLQTPHSVKQFTRLLYKNNFNRSAKEFTRLFLNRWHKRGALIRYKHEKEYVYELSDIGKKALGKLSYLATILKGDMGFVRVKSIEVLKPQDTYVYDLSAPGHENFIAGFGGVVCHNSRFDLKFAIIDKPDKTNDERLTDHVIMSRTDPKKVIPVIDIHLLRKYIAYAKQQVKDLVLMDEAAQMLKSFYIEMRSPAGEGGPVGITLRQYEALLRLAEASAKIRLDTHIRKQDAERSIKLMQYSLRQLGFDRETGVIDIDKLEGGFTTGKRKRLNSILEIIEKLQQTSREVAEADILAEAQNQGISEKDAQETIEKLRKDGTIFEPRGGHYRRT